MQIFLKPSHYILNRLKYSQKFGLIGILILLPIAVTLYFLIVELNKTIIFAEHERNGVEYNNKVSDFLLSTLDHERASNAALTGDSSAKERATAAQTKLNDIIKQLDGLDQKHADVLQTSEKWKELKAKWRELETSQSSINQKDNFDKHTAIASDSVSLLAYVGDKSNLILDPELDSYYLMDATLIRLPTLIAGVGELRELGEGIAKKKQITKEERTAFIYKLANLKSAYEAVLYGLDVVYSKDPKFKETLSEPVKIWNDSFTGFAKELTGSYIEPDAINVKFDTYLQAASKVIEANQSLYAIESKLLDELLVKRVNQSEKIKFFVVSFVAVVFFIVFYVFAGFYTSIMRAIKALKTSSEEVAKGNLLTSIRAETKDEMAEAAIAFNKMIGEVKHLIYTSKQTAEQVAATSDEIVHIADQTMNSNRQLSSSMQETMKSAQTQLNEMENCSQGMDEITQVIQRIAESSSIVSIASGESSKSAAEGNQFMEKTNVQMTSIQESVNHTAEEIDQLHQFTRQISNIIEVIKGISSQINLLALNAAIEAARVGEYGSGFRVVANETRKLANQSSSSVEDISELIEQIQGVSEKTVQSMLKVQDDVQLGQELVSASSAAFGDILQSATEIAQQIRDVSVASEEMAASSQGAAATFSEITHITQASFEKFKSVSNISQEQLASMEKLTNHASILNQMAQTLRSQIGNFSI